jgi:hypothetical protein
MKSTARLIVLALLGVAIATPSIAQWKWRDKDGRVQYSDRPPPPGVAEKDILSKPAGGRAVAVAPSSLTPAAPAAAQQPAARASDPQLEAKKKQQEQEETAKRKADEEKLAKTRADNCQRARSYQRTLDDGIRIARTNEKGEREILDDAARAKEMERTRQIIASECG